MKKCWVCKKLLSNTEFYKDRTKKDGLCTKCKSCNKKQRDTWRRAHPNKHHKQQSRQHQRTRKRNLKFIREYKLNHGCSNCGYKESSVALDFHHINPTTKLNSISRLANDCYSLHKIKLEMKKCTILCANCHRVIEYEKKN